MNKFRDMKDELNRKNKEIERLKAKDSVKYSVKLDEEINKLNQRISVLYSENFELKKELAECVKGKRKLEDAKK